MTGLHIKSILYKVTYIYYTCLAIFLSLHVIWLKGKNTFLCFLPPIKNSWICPYDWFYSGFLGSTQQTWERLQPKQIIYKPNGKE